MMVPSRHYRIALLISLLSGCAGEPPAPANAGPAAATFDPAPMPFVRYQRQPSTVGSLEIPILPKAPPGTGAVPVSSSPIRGSIVSGFKQNF